MTSHTEVVRLKGLIASGAMSVASPHDGAVFYSDDAGKNRVAVEAYAKRCGQAGKQTTTLEATRCGQWLESEHLYASPLSLSADDIWAEASVKYAREASGSCRCLVAHAPSDRVFRKHELATLLDNDKVTDLNNIPRQTLKSIHDRDPGAAFSALEQADLALRGAKVSDFHVCPVVTGVVPHVDGPISMGCPTVAARVGDMAVCVGPPDIIAKGSTKVFIGGMPAARISDSTAHGGQIVLGAFTVLIG